MANGPDVSIVIVNWNSKEFLRKCLMSLQKNIRSLDYEVIIVDSGSFDGAAEMVADEFPEVHFIQSSENIGFARANNLGESFAKAETLLFLNPDTEIENGALDELYATSHGLRECGIVGARLLNTDRTLQTSCVLPNPNITNQVLDSALLQSCFPRCPLWMSALTFDGTSLPQPVDAVSGACMLVSRDVYRKIGGFSADYFMYAEDIDICMKARSAGLLNYYVPTAEIIHHGGGSSFHSRGGFSDVMMRESLVRLLRKTHSPAYAFAFRVAMGCNAACRLLLLLAASTPLVAPMRLAPRIRSGLKKWSAILRWSLGLEAWVFHYRSKLK